MKIKLVFVAIIILTCIYFTTDYLKRQSKIPEKVVEHIKTPIDRASEVTRIANLKILDDAIRQYRYEKGNYPDTINELLSSGYIDRIPVGEWDYNPVTGEIK